MTLGGVEQKIHSKPGISYAKLLSKDGWFQVNLLDIALGILYPRMDTMI